MNFLEENINYKEKDIKSTGCLKLGFIIKKIYFDLPYRIKFCIFDFL